ncbi:hypothetical protein, partial [Escherichia coli]|uniref:hypothetical protein n=1 Tax=Escherichia coli TaxID=562 RepID=UPI003EE01A10
MAVLALPFNEPVNPPVTDNGPETVPPVVVDGSANINLPGVNTTGNQNTTGNAATATKLQTAR